LCEPGCAKRQLGNLNVQEDKADRYLWGREFFYLKKKKSERPAHPCPGSKCVVDQLKLKFHGSKWVDKLKLVNLT